MELRQPTLCIALGLWAALWARPAAACGGLFCSQANPVNQTAERIVFADHGDGRVTAIIEILYQGPSENFSWVLPVAGEPEIGVSSTLALDRLQSATAPQYQLQTVDSCQDIVVARAKNGVDGAVDAGAALDIAVLASGVVGPYDYKLIAPAPGLDDPAASAIAWLEDNGYDVGALASERLGPYLAEGLNLLAFRLSKDRDSGSIRPLRLTYAAEHPAIPIRPTAVAAAADMGILVWVLGDSRAVPSNYKHLVLNEALIDWFNPGSTYDAVVSAAADEAGGHGFVTEMADATRMLEGRVVTDFERGEWADLVGDAGADGLEFARRSANLFSEWDGFREALAAAVTLPSGQSLEDFLNDLQFGAADPGVTVDSERLRQLLESEVVAPVFETQDLLDQSSYFTRLYTTLSPEEMSLDPIFDTNPDLPAVSNVHVAERRIDCDGGVSLTLPQGTVVEIVEPGVWPLDIGDGDQAAARRIEQLGSSGLPEVLVDNGDVPDVIATGATDGGSSGPAVVRGAGGIDGGAGDGGPVLDGCGCNVPGGRGPAGGGRGPWLGLLLAGLVLRRRR
ncbi:MAG: DUF2330 domain-containing protein [Myxococcales bacterium]|nr:DUF2330 domain-containing protein [Myxococcales bacterium]